MRLTGWKSIANYLDVSVKTAKRWYRDYDMPLERTPGGRPTQRREALDSWLAEKRKKAPAFG